VKIGKAIDADIPETTTFHRKNYYYPDLPKNFQLTQYDAPICQSGELEVRVDSEPRTMESPARISKDPGASSTPAARSRPPPTPW